MGRRDAKINSRRKTFSCWNRRREETKTRLSSLTRKGFFEHVLNFLTTTFSRLSRELGKWRSRTSELWVRVLPSIDGVVYCLCDWCDWLIWFFLNSKYQKKQTSSEYQVKLEDCLESESLSKSCWHFMILKGRGENSNNVIMKNLCWLFSKNFP